MKYIFLLLFLFQITYAQEKNESVDLFKLLLSENGYGNGELRIVSNPNKEFIKRGYNYLKEKKTFKNPLSNNEIKITNREKRKIIRGLKEIYNIDELEAEFKGFKFITFEEIGDFLDKKNTFQNSNRIMMFSKPVYIRNGEFAIIYFLHMCCGGGGHSSVWFYKKVDGKWENWIPVSQSSY